MIALCFLFSVALAYQATDLAAWKTKGLTLRDPASRGPLSFYFFSFFFFFCERNRTHFWVLARACIHYPDRTYYFTTKKAELGHGKAERGKCQMHIFSYEPL